MRRFIPWLAGSLLVLGVLVVAAGALSVDLLAHALGVAATAAGVGAFGLGTTVGAITETTTPDHHKVPDYSMLLTHHKPHRNPLDNLLRRLKLAAPARAVEIHWEEVDSHERQDTVTSAVTAGSAGASKTVTVGNGAMWRVHDIIDLPESATAPQLYITAVSGNTLTVYAIAESGWGTVPAVEKDAPIVRLCNAKEEYGLASDSRAMMPEKFSNYCTIQDAVVTISGTREVTKNYTSEQDWARSKSQQLTDFRESISNGLYFGTKGRTTLNGEELRFQKGIHAFIKHNNIDYGVGSLTEAKVMGWAKTVGTDNSGSRNRWCPVDAELAHELDTLVLSKLERSSGYVQRLGFHVTRLKSQFCTLNFFYEPAFDRLRRKNFGMILDMAHIRRRVLRPMERINLKQKENGRDGRGMQLLEEAGLEVRYSATHAVLNGSTT